MLIFVYNLNLFKFFENRNKVLKLFCFPFLAISRSCSQAPSLNLADCSTHLVSWSTIFSLLFIIRYQDKIPITLVSQVNIMRVNVCLCGSSLCNGLREETGDLNNNSHTDTVVTNGKTWSLSNDILILDDELNNRHQHHQQRNTMRQQKFISQNNDPMVATSKITSG